MNRRSTIGIRILECMVFRVEFLGGFSVQNSLFLFSIYLW